MAIDITGPFYKYCGISSRGKEDKELRRRLAEVIVECKMFYARPSKLNDPYDCRPAVTTPKPQDSRRKAKKIMKSLVKDNQKIDPSSAKPSKEKQRTTVTNAVKYISDEERQASRLYEILDKNTGIYCTSRIANSSLQLAYYGDSQAGVCLEFTVTSLDDITAMAVKYPLQRPVIDVLKFIDDTEYSHKHLAEIIGTKADAWEREEEVRFIASGDGSKSFRPQMLSSVIFGLSTKQDDIDYVSGLVKRSSATPDIKQCVMDHKTFEIHIQCL